MSRYNVIFAVYWLVVAVVYALSTDHIFKLVTHTDQIVSLPEILTRMFPYLVAARGMVLALAWFINQSFVQRSGGRDEDAVRYTDLSQAMRAELIPFLIEGIHMRERVMNGEEALQEGHDASEKLLMRQSTTKFEDVRLSVEMSHPNLKISNIGYVHRTRPLKFKSHKENIFREIRRGLRVDFLELKGIAKEKTKDGGKTDAFMYWSDEMPPKFVFKTITQTDRRVLREILPVYAKYLEANPHSLLTKIVGCFSIKYEAQTITFMVMKNVLMTTKKLHHLFDLKGSTVDRTVTDPEKNVLKDNNFRGQHSIQLRKEDRHAVLRQLHADSEFLKSQNIMDYSLLLGIHKSFISCNPVASRIDTQERFSEGLPAVQMEGATHFFFGVVDILQKWVLKKKFELFVKTRILRWSRQGLSAQNPDVYQRRSLIDSLWTRFNDCSLPVYI